MKEVCSACIEISEHLASTPSCFTSNFCLFQALLYMFEQISRFQFTYLNLLDGMKMDGLRTESFLCFSLDRISFFSLKYLYETICAPLNLTYINSELFFRVFLFLFLYTANTCLISYQQPATDRINQQILFTKSLFGYLFSHSSHISFTIYDKDHFKY